MPPTAYPHSTRPSGVGCVCVVVGGGDIGLSVRLHSKQFCTACPLVMIPPNEVVTDEQCISMSNVV